jgi:hypothetical protein
MRKFRCCSNPGAHKKHACNLWELILVLLSMKVPYSCEGNPCASNQGPADRSVGGACASWQRYQQEAALLSTKYSLPSFNRSSFNRFPR